MIDKKIARCNSVHLFLKNKSAVIIIGIFSILFAAAIVTGNNIIYSDDIFGNYLQNYILAFTRNDLLSLILYFIAIFIIMVVIFLFLQYLKKYIIQSDKFKPQKNTKHKYILIASLIFMVCWSPYLLSNMPGAVYSDAFSSIRQALGITKMINHHPIMYTLFIKVMLKLGRLFGDINVGITLYTIFQMMVMSIVMGYLLSWMYENKISYIYIIIAGFFIAFFPLFPFYAIAMWKDTFFSLALLLYSLFLFDIIRSKGDRLAEKRSILYYILISFFVAFLRNNGIYVIMFCTLIIAFIYRKQLLKKFKAFFLTSLLMLIFSLFIQTSIYNLLGLNTEFVENLGIPFQQVARVAVMNGDITEEQLTFINQIIPIEELKNQYAPCIIDTIKNSPAFNEIFLDTHKKEFIKLWIDMFWTNKKIYLDAFLLENAGFWDINFGTGERSAYVQIGVWPYDDFIKELGIKSADYFQQWFGFSFMNIVNPKEPIREGVFVWLLLGSFTLSLCNNNRKYSIIYVPSILLWLTIIVATPLAMSLRYIYIFVLIIPLIPAIPILDQN